MHGEQGISGKLRSGTAHGSNVPISEPLLRSLVRSVKKSQGPLDPEELSFLRTVRLRNSSMAIGAGDLLLQANKRVILMRLRGLLASYPPVRSVRVDNGPHSAGTKLARQSCMSSLYPAECEREICATVLLMHRHARGPLIDCRVWGHKAVMSVLISIVISCRSYPGNPVHDSITDLWLPSDHAGLFCDL